MAQNKRLDVALFEQNFTDSRAKAGALIMAGQVYVNGQKITKAGYALKDTDKIEVRGEKLPFVSRGGLKLDKAMKNSAKPKPFRKQRQSQANMG